MADYTRQTEYAGFAEGDTDVIELVDLISKASRLMKDTETKAKTNTETRDECVEP